MIEIKKLCNFYDLKNELWSGALDTMNTIIENQKTDELMRLLEEIFYEPTEIIKINDFMWFDRDYIYEQLGIEEELTENISIRH